MNIQSLGTLPAAGFEAPRPNPTESVGAAPATPNSPPAKAVNLTEQAPQAVKEVQPSREELDKAVKAVNDFVGGVNKSLNFSVDKDSGITVVKVIDNTTQEVIKQFPSEQMLAIAKALDSLKGLLVQQKA